MSLAVSVAPHATLELGAFVSRFARPLGELVVPDEVARALVDDVPVSADTRAAVRDLLRAGGFKPSGRSKPASEYLAGVQSDGRQGLHVSINAAVDVCNLASLYSGLPISVVDIDRLTIATDTLRVACAPVGTSFAFNPSGQLLDAGLLLCLFDDVGPTGTPVKDAQRTKTHAETRATLSLVWGTRALHGRTAAVTARYRAAMASLPDTTVEDVAVRNG